MRKLINQVRQQPYKTRETIMWISSFVVFSLFLAVWVMDFQADSLALLNPQEVKENITTVAEEETNNASPFAAILTAFGDVKEKLTSAFSSDNNNVVEETREPVTLPLSK